MARSFFLPPLLPSFLFLLTLLYYVYSAREMKNTSLSFVLFLNVKSWQ